MADFVAINLTDQAPTAICATCAAGGLHHEPTGTDLAHCAHTLTGAYRARGREWKTVRGVELHAFKSAVATALFKVELRADLERDLQRILGEQAKQSTKH